MVRRRGPRPTRLGDGDRAAQPAGAEPAAPG